MSDCAVRNTDSEAVESPEAKDLKLMDDGFVRVRIPRPSRGCNTSVSFDEKLYRMALEIFGDKESFVRWVQLRYREFEQDRKRLIAKREDAKNEIVLPGQKRSKVVIMSFSRALQRELHDEVIATIGGYPRLYELRHGKPREPRNATHPA